MLALAGSVPLPNLVFTHTQDFAGVGKPFASLDKDMIVRATVGPLNETKDWPGFFPGQSLLCDVRSS
jgi:hypothetical protein